MFTCQLHPDGKTVVKLIMIMEDHLVRKLGKSQTLQVGVADITLIE